MNGEEVSRAEIERAAVYLRGQAHLERAIRRLLVVDALEAPDRAEMARRVDRAIEEAAERWGLLTRDWESGMRILAPGGLEKGDDLERRFDRAFLIDGSARWNAAVERASAHPFIAALQEKLSPAPPPPEALRFLVLRRIQEEAILRTASDGLSPEAVLEVNGRTLGLREAFDAIAPLLMPTEEDVLRWIRWSTATRQALEEQGVWMGEEESRQAFEAHEGPDPASPHYGVKHTALEWRRFPSYEIYKRYFRVRTSFEIRIEREITDEAIRAYLDRFRGFLGGGTIDAQVIFLPTPGAGGGEFSDDAASARAAEGAEALRNGESFESLLARDNAFTALSQIGSGRTGKDGRLGPQRREVLRDLLGETEFESIVRGSSIADVLFDEARVGEIVGPLGGPGGYYVARVLSKSPHDLVFDLQQENHRSNARAHFLDHRFLEWSRGVVARAEVEVVSDRK